MKTLAAALAFLTLATTGRADWLMVQKIEGMGQEPVEMTIKVQGDKFRMDMASAGVTMLMDAASGDVTNIMHQQKMLMRIKKTDMEALAKQMGTEDAPETPKQKLEATGRTEQIHGYKADEYIWNMADGTKASYWIVRDFPDYNELARALERMQNLGPSNAMKKLNPKVTDFPGMPVRTIMETQGRTVKTDMVTVKKENFPASDFEVPAGYKEMAVPQMTAPAAPPKAP